MLKKIGPHHLLTHNWTGYLDILDLDTWSDPLVSGKSIYSGSQAFCQTLLKLVIRSALIEIFCVYRLSQSNVLTNCPHSTMIPSFQRTQSNVYQLPPFQKTKKDEELDWGKSPLICFASCFFLHTAALLLSPCEWHHCCHRCHHCHQNHRCHCCHCGHHVGSSCWVPNNLPLSFIMI